MSGGNWPNQWPPQHPQQPHHPQHDMYQQNQGYGYNQQQARGPPPQMRQNEYQSYQQQHQRQVPPSAYNRPGPPHPQQQQYHHQHNYMPQQHHGYHPQQQQFMFNANATVFVPRNQAVPTQLDYGYYAGPPYHQQPQQSPHYQQNQYAVTTSPSSSYNAMYQEDPAFDAFAQFGQQSQQYLPSKELVELMQSSRSSNILTEVLVGCEQLIAEGEEDSPTWITAIRARFEGTSMDDESKKIGVKLIVEMAYSMELMESNQNRSFDPQQTFAKLLKTLSVEFKDFMRKFIIPVLEEYHNSRKQLENDARVSMAVFYAEMFVKLTLDNGSRFERIGEAFTEQIAEILKFQPSDEYMEKLLRAFKISGPELDASEILRQRFDLILTTMGGYAKGSPLLSESMKAKIFSLIECRTRGWDRPAAREDSGTGYMVDRNQDSCDESIENDLTEEEAQFLESRLDQIEASKAAEDDIDDQEVMKEFGKFVKEELQQAEDLKTSEMLQNCNIKDEETGKTTTKDKQ